MAAILFAAMAFTVPLPVYFLMLAGLLSYAALIEMSLFGFAILGLIGVIVIFHVLVYGTLMVLISRAMAKFLIRYEGMGRGLRFSAVLLALFLIGCCPVFGYTGHEAYDGVNAYSLLALIFNSFS